MCLMLLVMYRLVKMSYVNILSFVRSPVVDQDSERRKLAKKRSFVLMQPYR